MTDTITLPREVVESAIAALESSLVRAPGGTTWRERESITALRTHLAAEQPKPEPVATVGTQSNAAWKGYDGRWSPPGDPIKVVHLLRDLPLGTLLYAAPPEDEALRRDAERYWWLRNRACHGPHERFVSEYGWFDVSGQHEPGFDAAIDAAMQEGT